MFLFTQFNWGETEGDPAQGLINAIFLAGSTGGLTNDDGNTRLPANDDGNSLLVTDASLVLKLADAVGVKGDDGEDGRDGTDGGIGPAGPAGPAGPEGPADMTTALYTAYRTDENAFEGPCQFVCDVDIRPKRLHRVVWEPN